MTVLSALALSGFATGAEVLAPRPDAAIQALALHAQHIKPTVTKEMGDVGGKLFGRVPEPAKTRHYYIAAEVDVWDFAPGKMESVCGMSVPPQVASNHTATKLRYFQYTDETFTARVRKTPRLGVLGPVLRGVVGENLAVTFLNRTAYPLSMHPHGVKYDKDNEGSLSPPSSGLGSAVGPGARFTYVWHIDEASGPLPGEASSKGWLYHSHVNGDQEANLGLVGLIIVTDPARSRSDGTPRDVDREMAALFMIFSESGFDEADEEAAESGVALAPGERVRPYSEILQERELGFRYAINGYTYGNLPGLEVNEGERVRWYLFALGDENDIHTPHWHGLRVIEENRRRTDVVELLPATMKTADMIADNPGTWLFHCHVAEHMQEGMFAQLVVHSRTDAGARRAPEVAFLGLPGSAQSLWLESAEATVDLAAGAKQLCEIKLRGKNTVFDAFSVFNAPVRLQFGGKSVALQPGTDGLASNEGVNYRVLNSGKNGVVYGGIMEWEATLTGELWLRELEKFRDKDKKAAAELPVPVQLSVGDAKHAATARVRIQRR